MNTILPNALSNFRYTFHVDVRRFTNFGCKLHKFLLYWNGQTTAMVLIVMTLERFVTICFPYQKIMTITKKKLACILLCLSFCIACLTSHFWWTYSLYEQNDLVSQIALPTTPVYSRLVSEEVDFQDQENVTNSFITITKLVCSYREFQHRRFLNKYWPWINLAFYSLIPFFIISALNLLLLTKLTYSVYERKRNLGQVANSFKIGGSSLLLISAGLLYLFCTGPIAIYHIYKHIWRESHAEEPYNPELQAYRSLWRSVLENISYLTNALNLLVYCISGSRFRRELILMMTCKTATSEGKYFNRAISKSASSLNTSIQSLALQSRKDP